MNYATIHYNFTSEPKQNSLILCVIFKRNSLKGNTIQIIILQYQFQKPTQLHISRKVFLSPGGMYTSYDQGFLGVNQLQNAG